MSEEKHIQAIRKKFSGEREDVAKLLHNALNVITTTLNASDHHFLHELIQNAEDNSYTNGQAPRLNFILNEECKTLMVLNNEDGFKYENVESICTVGESTKKKYKQMGYIGEKGLGFKSVFQVASDVSISSNGYKFSLSSVDDPELHIPYIIPKWQPSLTSNSGATILLLRLKNRKKLAIVKKGLQRMAPESILFLNKLHELRVSLQDEVSKVSRDGLLGSPLVTLRSDKCVTYHQFYKTLYTIC